MHGLVIGFLSSFPHLTDINEFCPWSVCLLTGLKPPLVDKLLPLLWLKSCWKGSFLPAEPLLNFSHQGTRCTGQILRQVCAPGQLCNALALLTILDSLGWSDTLVASLTLHL